MRGDADIAAAAALLAEPTRATLVTSVIADGELPVTDLAARAHVAPSTASEHLARLVAGGFLSCEQHGRHRYYRLADPAVAAAVEALALVAPQPPVRSLREATRSQLLRTARTCYDHLAGRIGVALAEALERDGTLVRSNGGYELGPNSGARLDGLGIDRPPSSGCAVRSSAAAWTGASGSSTSPARSALRSRTGSSSSAGSGAARALARSR